MLRCQLNDRWLWCERMKWICHRAGTRRRQIWERVVQAIYRSRCAHKLFESDTLARTMCRRCSHCFARKWSTEQQLAVLRSRLVERTPTAPLRQAEAVVRRRHESGPQQA